MGSLPNLNELCSERAHRRQQEKERDLAREQQRERDFARGDKGEQQRLPIFIHQVFILYFYTDWRTMYSTDIYLVAVFGNMSGYTFTFQFLFSLPFRHKYHGISIKGIH